MSRLRAWGDKEAGVAQHEIRALGELFGKLPGSLKQPSSGEQLGHETKVVGLGRRQRLARQQEVASPVDSHQQRHHDVNAVAGNHVAGEVRRITNACVVGREHDVGQQGHLEMPEDWPVDRSDDRRLDREEIFEHSHPLAARRLPLRRRCAWPRRRGRHVRAREHVARAGENDDASLVVACDLGERLNPFAVGGLAPLQRPALGMKPQLENAVPTLYRDRLARARRVEEMAHAGILAERSGCGKTGRHGPPPERVGGRAPRWLSVRLPAPKEGAT